MRNTIKILLTAALFAVCCTMLFAEAQHYNATVKVRAAVLELADANGNGVIVNRSGTARTISSGWLDTLLTFQSLNLSRDTIGIDARANIEFEFYNPNAMPEYAQFADYAGNTNINPTNFYNDQRNNPVYWLLPADCVTARALSQLDVLLVPYAAGDVYQLLSMNKTVKDWVARGGVLWYDTDKPSKSVPIDITPIVKLSFGKASGRSGISSTSPILDYPFVLDLDKITDLSEGSLQQTGTLGLEHNFSAITFNNDAPSYSVVKVGEGKVVFSFDSLTGKIVDLSASDDYKKAAFNMLYYALGNTTLRSGALTGLLGSSVTYTGGFAGKAKPIIDANRVIYTTDMPGNYAVYIEGEKLTNGQCPDRDKKLSKPAVLGENDVVVYDEDGVVYLYDGITYTMGGMNVGTGRWLKIYEPEDTDHPDDTDDFANTDYAPLVRDNWVYYADNYARLHCIYTKDLSSGEAQHSWVTKVTVNANDRMLLAQPLLYSCTESNGAYVTHVVMATRKISSDSDQPSISSVPVFVENEVCSNQPANQPSTDVLKPDLTVYPSFASNKMSYYKTEGGEYMLDVVCEYNIDDELPVEQFTLTEGSDYTVEDNKSLMLKSKRVTNSEDDSSYLAMSDDSDLVRGESRLKYVRLSDMKFILTYVPKYDNAPVGGGTGTRHFYIENNVLANAGDGFVIKLKTYDVDETGSKKNRYIAKIYNNSIITNGTVANTRAMQWSYLVHGGYDGMKLPEGTSTYTGSLKSEIDWEFPYGTTNLPDITSLSDPVAVGDRVYFTATATVDGINRTAVICVKNDPTYKLKIVDEDGNPVRLYSNKKNESDAWVRDKTYDVMIYQPDPVFKDYGPDAIRFNVRNAGLQLGLDEEQGIITITKNNTLRHTVGENSDPKWLPCGGVTAALPVFVSVDAKFLPIKNDTYPFIPDDYNENNTSNSLSVWDGDSNKTKKLYVDMSEWQTLCWYSILPGNTKAAICPVVSGDNVMVFAETQDENSSFVSNSVYTISPKANILSGSKVTDIKSSGLPDSLYLTGNSNVAMGVPSIGSNLIAAPAQVSGTPGIALFENSRTLVVDNNKVLEIDGNGDAAWRLTNPEMMIRDGNSWVRSGFTLNNPVKASYHVDDNFYNKSCIVVADAGRKAVMFFDKAGIVKTSSYDGMEYSWYFNRFVDQYGLMPSGQSSDLSNISDFQVWTEKLGDFIYRYHITVADSGNKRIVDMTLVDNNGHLEDCFVTDKGEIMPYLNWICYDSFTDKKFKFTSVQVSDVIRDPVAGKDVRLVVAGIANFNAAERSGLKKSKGGSVLIYSYDLLDNTDTVNRYGKAIDSIGKKTDKLGVPGTFGDMLADSVSNKLLQSISGLKKAVITGYHFNQGSESADMSHIGIAVLDDSGIVEYVVARDGSNSPIQNSDGTYQWKGRRFVTASYFGMNSPEADKLTRGSQVAEYSLVTFPGRVKAFSADYYKRAGFASGYSQGSNTTYRNNWLPLKAPLVPMDLKVLGNGNWLVTNGFSGDLNYRYKNPYDGNVYLAKGKYTGEVFEVDFQDVYDGNENNQEWWAPRLVWSNTNIRSYNVDDYLPNIEKSPRAIWFLELADQIALWNRTVEEMDGVIYPDPSVADNGDVNQPTVLGTIVGGWRNSGAKMSFPKSADR
ncbi:MAG: hypothetical protein IK083_04260 [Abditibacteriota bacterium]|nr:hypothetical protein [Abditibacteriota bacterium]